MMHCLVDLYQNCLNYAPGVKRGLALGSLSYYLSYIGKILKKSSDLFPRLFNYKYLMTPSNIMSLDCDLDLLTYFLVFSSSDFLKKNDELLSSLERLSASASALPG